MWCEWVLLPAISRGRLNGVFELNFSRCWDLREKTLVKGLVIESFTLNVSWPFFFPPFFSLMLTLALILKFSAACLPLPHLCDSRDCVHCGIKCPRILSFELWLFIEITISNFFPPCKRGTTRTSYNLARSNDFPSFLWLNSRSARGWQNFWNVNAFNSSSGVLNCQNLAIFSLSWYGMLHANSTSLCLKFKIFVG